MAGFSTAALNAATDGIRALLTSSIGYVSVHTADPGTTGANEATGTGYARGASTFPSASTGASVGSQADVDIRTGTGTTVTHWGLWTAVSGGSFVTGGAVSPSEVFSTAGGTFQFTPTLGSETG